MKNVPRYLFCEFGQSQTDQWIDVTDPATNEVIARAKADLVCIVRGLLADPEMPLKAQQGRLDEIRTCIACNTCMESIFKRGSGHTRYPCR